MAVGPNQTGSALQNPVSSTLGYGSSLLDQTDEEEKKRKKEQQQGGNVGGVAPRLSEMIGY